MACLAIKRSTLNQSTVGRGLHGVNDEIVGKDVRRSVAISKVVRRI
jgi:hypothetical protein